MDYFYIPSLIDPDRTYHQGEIYRAWIETTEGEKGRPVVVVSRDDLNTGKYLVIVPFTTKHLEERKKQSNNVFFNKNAFGLTKDCVAQCEAVAQIHKSKLQEPIEPMGCISPPVLQDIQDAIAFVIGMKI